MKILSVLFCFLTMSFNFSPLENIVIVIQDGKKVAIDTPGDNEYIYDCTNDGPCQEIPLG